MESEPIYYVIDNDCEWVAVDLYGERTGPGYVVAGEDCIALYMENGAEQIALWQNGDGDLIDAGGNVLAPVDYLMLLPTPWEALD